MLRVRGLTISFGENPLLHDVSFHVAAGDRVGLVGANGAGKTTLLRIILGEIPAAASALHWVGGRPTIAHLPQEEDGEPIGAAGGPPGGGLAASAGERMRTRLAALLATHPALLLLDEPTNHLDDDAQAWIARRLAAFPGTIVLVSHDRTLLDAICTRILWVERGGLRSYDGNYTAAVQRREAELREQAERYAEWEGERRRLAEAARRQAAWAERAHRQAGERNPYLKKRAAKAMKKAMATETRLARHEARRVEKPWREPRLDLSFQEARRLPPVLVTVEDATFRYAPGPAEGDVPGGRPALRLPRLMLGRGERLALVGPNGSGKTTLIRLVAAAVNAGDAPAGELAGVVRVTPSARVLHFKQEGTLDPDRSALDQVAATGAPDVATARTLLAALGVAGEAALRPSGSLSPGERIRAALCLALVSGPDLLLLDEPTNHLDLPGREALERALREFRGSLLFASHDRAFRKAVATREVRLSAGGALG